MPSPEVWSTGASSAETDFVIICGGMEFHEPDARNWRVTITCIYKPRYGEILMHCAFYNYWTKHVLVEQLCRRKYVLFLTKTNKKFKVLNLSNGPHLLKKIDKKILVDCGPIDKWRRWLERTFVVQFRSSVLPFMQPLQMQFLFARYYFNLANYWSLPWTLTFGVQIFI